ncbi:uncharacterized protein LOC143020344 isoform X2 [Oratosquilla oratoria]|uniref:uncharacterized protein LOC143020344 isoform X2 n=1 Tax=Oratosquilla oratoria TaxID=337810 RepID=UPI003F769ADA
MSPLPALIGLALLAVCGGEALPQSSVDEYSTNEGYNPLLRVLQSPEVGGDLDDVHLRRRNLEDEVVEDGSNGLVEQSLHQTMPFVQKRLYPRWYQAFVMSKNPMMARRLSAGERKRFLPFHPLARFRGLALTSRIRPDGSARYAPASGSHSWPAADQPSAPQAPDEDTRVDPPEEPFLDSLENDDDAVGSLGGSSEDSKKKLSAGQLLGALRKAAYSRGLQGKAKIFRFGISRK